jgi:pimeloyl-ACP methyl ester carboxylesterase
MKPLIFLHGAIGAEDQLQPLCSYFSQHGYATHSFSFSGHGKMPFKERFGIEQFSAELLEFIQKNKLEQPHVFGYSMGGYVALHLAKHYPELCGTIITLGTKFNWSPEIAEKEIKMLDPENILSKVPKFAQALELRHGPEWKTLLKKTSEMMMGLGNKNVLTEIDFKNIPNKIVIGLADKDSMVSFDETLKVYQHLPNASMYVLPDSKHPIEAINLSVLSAVIQSALK